MIDDVKNISISQFLTDLKIPCNPIRGNRQMFKSPFCRDTNYSLCVYHNTNSFYDWSQGFGGSIIDLVMAIYGFSVRDAIRYLSNGKFEVYTKNSVASKQHIYKKFEYTRYITNDENIVNAIHEYARSRKLYNGYLPGVFYTLDKDIWVPNPSLMFLHRDENDVVCGAKFRKIYDTPTKDKDNKPRFSSRGKMAFFTLEYVDTENFGSPTLYIVEGEANAITLWQHCCSIHKNCVVISFGGVGNLPKALPLKYQSITDKRLIIDFDGDEELYKKRIELYKSYGAEPIKLMLPKSVDLNELAKQDKLYLINHLL